MKFTYRPSFRDNFHGALFATWGTPRRAAKSALFFLVSSAIIVVAIVWTRLPPHITALIVLLVAVAWGALFTYSFCALIAVLVTRRQRTKGHAEIVVSDEVLERRVGEANLKLQWSGISHIHETRRTFIMFEGDNPVFAVEKSAVESRDTLRSLREFLRGKKPGRYLKDA
jgi:hypothetical protein